MAKRKSKSLRELQRADALDALEKLAAAILGRVAQLHRLNHSGAKKKRRAK